MPRELVPMTNELERGRESHARRAWAAAFDSLLAADTAEGLAAADLDGILLPMRTKTL